MEQRGTGVTGADLGFHVTGSPRLPVPGSLSLILLSCVTPLGGVNMRPATK